MQGRYPGLKKREERAKQAITFGPGIETRNELLNDLDFPVGTTTINALFLVSNFFFVLELNVDLAKFTKISGYLQYAFV